MKTKPSVVADYNVHMIGVDRMDQLTSYYSFTHKTVKWWRKVFFWMVEVALVNTYIIHKKLQQSIEMPAKSHITLRREILIELCKPLMQLPKPPRRISSDHSLERDYRTNNTFLRSILKGKTAACAVLEMEMVNDIQLHLYVAHALIHPAFAQEIAFVYTIHS